MKEKIQQYGGFMASMVVPNLGAFIAWGLLTAMFIATGWIPNERFSTLVGPILNYLLPILIGYTGGYMVHGQRGGVIGALTTMGAVVGTSVPQLLGGMIDMAFLAGPVASPGIRTAEIGALGLVWVAGKETARAGGFAPDAALWAAPPPGYLCQEETAQGRLAKKAVIAATISGAASSWIR